MNRADFRDIANARIAARLKQVVVLFLAVVVGMLISVFVNVQEIYYFAHYLDYILLR